MKKSGVEDDDFIVRRTLHCSCPSILLNDDDLITTPPTDHALKTNKSLGLVTSPCTPNIKKLRPVSSRCGKMKLEVPIGCSTPVAPTPESRLLRSSKAENCNSSVGCLAASFINPLSPMPTPSKIKVKMAKCSGSQR